MSLKKAIAQHLLNDPDISPIIGNRVFSKRVKKTGIEYPYIVYTIDWYENKLWQFQGEHWYVWDKVVIDIVWPYSQEDDVDDLTLMIQKKLGWYKWSLWGILNVHIGIVFVENWYDEVSDNCIGRIALLIKYVY